MHSENSKKHTVEIRRCRPVVVPHVSIQHLALPQRRWNVNFATTVNRNVSPYRPGRIHSQSPDQEQECDSRCDVLRLGARGAGRLDPQCDCITKIAQNTATWASRRFGFVLNNQASGHSLMLTAALRLACDTSALRSVEVNVSFACQHELTTRCDRVLLVEQHYGPSKREGAAAAAPSSEKRDCPACVRDVDVTETAEVGQNQ